MWRMHIISNSDNTLFFMVTLVKISKMNPSQWRGSKVALFPIGKVKQHSARSLLG